MKKMTIKATMSMAQWQATSAMSKHTEWHTLVFDVVVLPGQAGKDIENTAVVDGDNIDDPDEPREDVEIYPREPKLESKNQPQTQMKAKTAMKSAIRLCIRSKRAILLKIACSKTSPSQTFFQKG